ncbi:winged helix-turn-helix transcriptional regulator [Streptomyces sp. 8N114]|uniref:winged helix-turn-helix transcriptional regulator n=1 Tax=Streptomyces sp. 8N114 TaxID=3457419 RepID=UPI003FD28C7E
MAVRECRTTFVSGLDVALDVAGGKWKGLILWALSDGPKRFGQLRRCLSGVSEKMLIQHLRELERDEVVHREVHHAVPPRVEYSLTGFGTTLVEALRPLGKWGTEHRSRLEEVRTATNARSTAAAAPGATPAE